ncbi:MAG: TMAO reductase system periplasmic protein TorT [Spirochaetaceae bacterium]
MKIKTIISNITLIIILSLFVSCENKEQYGESYAIYVVDPPFNTELLREEATYQMLNEAKKPWKIAVVIPHLKDDYWTGVVYGLTDEAKNMGIQLDILEAGGYENLEVQRAQLLRLIEDVQPDGIIISSVSYDGLNDLVELASDKKIPVIDLINGIGSEYISCRIASNFVDNGKIVGDKILNKSKEIDKLEVGWFPGPDGAGWVEAANTGFNNSIKNSDIIVHGPYYGDTGHNTQEKLMKKAFQDFPNIRYISGTAVTAEVAVSVIRDLGLKEKVDVSSFYYTAGIHKGITRKDISAAATDLQVLQSRIAIDTIIRIIERKEYYKHIEPQIQIVDTTNIATFDSTTSLAPAGFRINMSIKAP